MRSRVNKLPKPIGRRFSEDIESQDGLKVSFPCVVEAFLHAAGGGGGTFDGFYSNTGGAGVGGEKVTATIFISPDPTYDIGEGGIWGDVPAGADPGDTGEPGGDTTFEALTATGGSGGLPGTNISAHQQSPAPSNPYFTDAGVPAWPVGSNEPAIANPLETGRGGFGVDAAHGDPFGNDAAWRSANARGDSGSIHIVIRG